jgi:hypothetical protein
MNKRLRIPVVYVVGNRKEGKYKIGKTTSMDQRFANLSTSAPFKLEIIAQYPHQEYARLETVLHEQLKAFKVNREWFAFTDKELEQVAMLVGVFMEANPQRIIANLVPSDAPEFDPSLAIGNLKLRKQELLDELAEVEWLLEAATKYAKPLSAKKVEALMKLHSKKASA